MATDGDTRRILLLRQPADQLDQFLVNTNMAEATSPLRAEPNTVQTLKFPETVDDGDYPKPRPFGGMGKPIDQDGYSDHFPIGMRVTEAD